MINCLTKQLVKYLFLQSILVLMLKISKHSQKINKKIFLSFFMKFLSVTINMFYREKKLKHVIYIVLNFLMVVYTKSNVRIKF